MERGAGVVPGRRPQVFALKPICFVLPQRSEALLIVVLREPTDGAVRQTKW